MIGAFGTGGKERQLAELISGLDQNKFELHILLKSDNTYYLSKIQDHLTSVHILECDHFNFSTFLLIKKIINDLKPDIVHSWSDVTSLFGVVLKFFQSNRFKLIDGSIRAAESKPCLFCMNRLIRFILNLLCNMIISNSKAGLTSYKVPKNKGRVIYNGFNFERSTNLIPENEMRISFGLKDEFIVGMVARFDPQKNWQKFFQIAQQMISLHDNVTFLCVGGGPDLEYFKNELKSFGNKIVFTGKRSDIESIINIVSVGVLLSNNKIHGEGISNAILEFMALGKPVIANESGGNAEIINNSSVGRIIISDSNDEYIKILEEYMVNKEYLIQSGQSAKERIRTAFSFQSMIDQYSNVYLELCSIRTNHE